MHALYSAARAGSCAVRLNQKSLSTGYERNAMYEGKNEGWQMLREKY